MPVDFWFMKNPLRLFLIFGCIIIGLDTNAQVGIGTTSPDPTSQLDIISSSKGLLIPRLTTLQKSAINSPANGLLIYQLDDTPGFYFFDHGKWQRLVNSTEMQNGSGNTILSGTITPSNSLGNNGDFYLNTANTTLFGPKAAGLWPGVGTLLIGPQGLQGPVGPSAIFSGTFSGDVTGTQNATLIGNGVVVTSKLADAAVTDIKIAGGINPAKVGLGNVDDTRDANKPVSTATQVAIDLKESTANKATDLTTADNTKFPTTKAVADAITASQAGVSTALAAKENIITAGTVSQYFRGDKTFQALDKTAVGLTNVDNTADANKPVSTATQTAIDLKENTANKATDLSSPDDVKFPTTKAVADALTSNSTGKENTITAGTVSQYFRGDKTFQALDKTAVGLTNVDNTADANKPVSTATQVAIDLKESTANKATDLTTADNTKFPTTKAVADAITASQAGVSTALAAKENTITAGTVSQYFRGDKTFQALDKTAVGLTNVDNTADANKPVSTATQAAIDLKESTANKATDLTTADNTKFPTTKAVADAITASQAGVSTALEAKENRITAGTVSQYFRGDKTFQALDKTAVGLTNVDNTADANKPVSTATQTAIDLKENTANKATDLSSPDDVKFPTTKAVADALTSNSTGKENAITAGTTAQYFRGDKTFQTLDKTAVGLDNVDNTSDLNKPVSHATNAAMNLKENYIIQGTILEYFRGDKTFQTLDKTAVGLGSVNNTTDANKPISIAAQAAIDLKENAANKTTDMVSPDNIKFPTTKAVADALTATVNKGWLRTGNSGTDATNFFGTTDNVPLNFRVFNQIAGRIDHTQMNLFWGYQTGITNTTGTSNTLIGNLADVTANNLTNATAIGFNAKVNASNKVQIGNTGVATVKIGGPTTLLETAYLKVTNSAGSNKVLTSDADGLATWQTANWGWGLQGNAGTTDNTSFIGTMDNVPLNFKVNFQKAGRIDHILNNSFFGYLAGQNATGSNNTAVGSGALRSVTTANSNTAFGAAALSRNTTGADNVGIGTNALFFNTTGQENVAVGSSALLNNTEGINNVAIGNLAMLSNTSGKNNVAVGEALSLNRTGNENTATGYGALAFSTTGSSNVASGTYALNQNTTGSNNTAIGYNSLVKNTSGGANTAVGLYALGNSTTGMRNTAIGYSAGPAVGSNNLINTTAIGYNALVDVNNKVRIGGDLVEYIEGQVPFTSASDRRFKTDIQPMDKGLDFIMKLKPVSYRMKTGSDKRSNWGFIAQDVESLIGASSAVLTIGRDELRTLGLRYTDFISPMVKAMQELKEENDKIKTENAELKKLLLAQEEQQVSFESRLALIEASLKSDKNPASAMSASNGSLKKQ